MATNRTNKTSSTDVTNDATIIMTDPRRFTRTLHANLVSEILALRSDQNEKTRQIQNLENALHSVEEEHEHRQQNLTATSNESRSLKRQLSLLEDETSFALGEMAREREEAVNLVAKMKKRLDLAQKTIRNQEDDSQRIYEMWAQDRNDWDNERRKYERELHIAESRLKTVLAEVAAYHTNQTNGTYTGVSRDHESDGEDSGEENSGSVVNKSTMTNTTRHSLLSLPAQYPGNSLADELNFDDDDQADLDGRESVLSIRTSPKPRKTLSQESVVSRLHRRNHSIEKLKQHGNVAWSKLCMNPAVLGAMEKEDAEIEAQTQAAQRTLHTDTNVQYSPSLLPDVSQFKSPTPDMSTQGVGIPICKSHARANAEIERVQGSQPLAIEPPMADNKMVSAASQTTELSPSPLKTPQSSFIQLQLPESAPVMMNTPSIQNEDPANVSPDVGRSPPRPVPPMRPLQIPTSKIQSPTSRPTTPYEPRLPQHFTNFGSQVTLPSSIPTSDEIIQTDEIQVDKRLTLLPLHLQPFANSCRPTSPMVSKSTPNDELAPAPGNTSRRNTKRLINSHGPSQLPSSPIPFPGNDEKSYVGLIDDYHSSTREGALRRGSRLISIFAGSDTASSDEYDEFGDMDVSNSEYPTALSAPRPQSTSARTTQRELFGAATTSPEQKPTIRSAVELCSTELCSRADKENQQKEHGTKLNQTYEKPSAPRPPSFASSRTSSIRHGAMIQSCIATPQSRPRSPSLPDGQYSPFPIPNRASSRRPQASLYTSSNGRESPTRGEMWHSRDSNRSSHWSHRLHNVRSASALPRVRRYCRNGSRSPPPLFSSTGAPESPDLPPLPQNDITTSRNGRDTSLSGYHRHRHELSTIIDNTKNTAHSSDISASSAVIDAIAQTMVGEWMLKYVRRRKSFSIAESNKKYDTSNDRRKRWVWLAPYERSILWSSKQPSSGSAFLGKTGRKLTVQSVLDVKDDNPTPKDLPSVFNRSILILTPQRALKFTASSAEGHYLWVTALSFLAHSSQKVPEINSVPHPQVKPIQVLPGFEAFGKDTDAVDEDCQAEKEMQDDVRLWGQKGPRANFITLCTGCKGLVIHQ